MALHRTQSLRTADDDDDSAFPKTYIWDWPFCEDGVAKCLATKEKFTVQLEFTCGKNEKFVQAKKFEQLKESNFSCSLGLSSADGSNCFWRLEIEILRHLNMVVIEAFRDISHTSEPGKTLRRLRKVYRLPEHFDIATLQTGSFSAGSITLEAFRRRVTPTTAVGKRRLVNGHRLKRSGSAAPALP